MKLEIDGLNEKIEELTNKNHYNYENVGKDNRFAKVNSESGESNNIVNDVSKCVSTIYCSAKCLFDISPGAECCKCLKCKGSDNLEVRFGEVVKYKVLGSEQSTSGSSESKIKFIAEDGVKNFSNVFFENN